MPVKPPRPDAGHYRRLVHDLDCKRQRAFDGLLKALNESSLELRIALPALTRRQLVKARHG